MIIAGSGRELQETISESEEIRRYDALLKTVCESVHAVIVYYIGICVCIRNVRGHHQIMTIHQRD